MNRAVSWLLSTEPLTLLMPFLFGVKRYLRLLLSDSIAKIKIGVLIPHGEVLLVFCALRALIKPEHELLLLH